MNRSTTPRARHSSVSLMRMGIFTALIAVGAFIRIPVPICPFTLQLLFTTLAGILLGSRRGGGAVLVYLALGLAGVPVFYRRSVADGKDYRNFARRLAGPVCGGLSGRPGRGVWMWYGLCVCHQ